MKIFKVIKKTIFKYLPKKYYRQSFLICLANFVGDLFELIGIGFIPIIIYNIFNPVELNQFLDEKNIVIFNPILSHEFSIFITFSILIIFFSFKNIFLLLVFYFQRKLLIKIDNSQKAEIFDRYLNCDYEYFIQKNPSYLISLINVGVPETTSIIENILVILREIFLILIIFISIYFISPYAAIITTFCLILFVLIFYLLTSKMALWRGKIFFIYKIKNIKVVNETFDLIKEIKLYGKENFFHKLFKYQQDISEKQKLFNSIFNVLPRYIIEISLLIVLLLILYFSYYFLGDVNESIPVITFISVSAIRLIPAFRMIATSFNTIIFRSTHLDTVLNEFEYLDKNIPVKINSSFKEKDVDINFTDKIEISDLSFSYKNSKYNSISIPKFQIKKGEKIGIIGESGSGKSTFINLLIGFLKPTSGQITVDGHNIGENMIGWSKKIGYVPQEINFLDDNIKRNIAIGIEDENIDAERLKNAIKIANLTEFISKSGKYRASYWK